MQNDKFNGLPDAHLDRPQSITFEERDKLLGFNTKIYWWCFYDKDKKKLYNEYCILLLEGDKAFNYLLNIGLIDKDSKMIEYFEKE